MITVLPEACGDLHNLEYANLFDCERPVEVKNWIKLRKFYYRRNMETPKGIGKLVWLQQLTYREREQVNNEPECSDGIEELANLNLLEILLIYDLQKAPIDAERANLEGKTNLRELALIWDEMEAQFGMMRCDQEFSHFQLFEALQPPTGLRNLVIYNFRGSNLPAWMCVQSGLQNLEKLELKNFEGVKQLPAAVGQLPCLKSLDIKGMPLKSLGIGGFPSLINLYLTDMFVLEEMSYSYPCLQNLWINGCKSLLEMPPFPSLVFLDLEKVDHKLVSSVGKSQTSLTSLFLDNIEELIYFPVSILQKNCGLQVLEIKECNQCKGFIVNYDGNDNKVALLGPDFYNVSLQTLVLLGCPVLKFLPDLRGWSSLRKLTIFSCPQVKESVTYDLKSLSFLRYMFVDFIQRDEQRGDPSNMEGFINLIDN